MPSLIGGTRDGSVFAYFSFYSGRRTLFPQEGHSFPHTERVWVLRAKQDEGVSSVFLSSSNVCAYLLVLVGVKNGLSFVK